MAQAGAPRGAGPCAPARADWEALSFEEALAGASLVLERDPSRPLECLEVKALAAIVLGRGEVARIALGELFERAPDHPVHDPSLSPAQRADIEVIRESVRPLHATVRPRWLIHDALRVDVALQGGLRDASRVRLRVQLGPSEQPAMVELDGRVATATVSVPASLDEARVRVTGQVLTALERVVHQFETELLLPPRPPPPEVVVVDGGGLPWFVWTGLGLVAAGASAVIVVLAQPDLPDASRTAGRVEVSE